MVTVELAPGSATPSPSVIHYRSRRAGSRRNIAGESCGEAGRSPDRPPPRRSDPDRDHPAPPPPLSLLLALAPSLPPPEPSLPDPPLAPTAAGTWRLDDLPDRARIEGTTAAAEGVKALLLHRIEGGHAGGGVFPSDLGVGLAPLEKGDGVVRLRAASGRAAARIDPEANAARARGNRRRGIDRGDRRRLRHGDLRRGAGEPAGARLRPWDSRRSRSRRRSGPVRGHGEAGGSSPEFASLVLRPCVRSPARRRRVFVDTRRRGAAATGGRTQDK